MLFPAGQVAYNSRDIHHILLAVGGGFNAVISKVLKRLFRQQRPSATCALLGICEEYGLPSSHAQILSFSLALVLLWAYRLIIQSSTSKLERAVAALEVVTLTALTAVTGYARVYLGYHSAVQVVLGTAAGLAGAFVQYAVTVRYLLPYGAGVKRTKLAKLLDLQVRVWPAYYKSTSKIGQARRTRTK